MTKGKIYFQETQRFKQIWIWLLLVGINAQFIFAIVYQVVLGHPFGNNPMSNMGVLISFIISLLLSLLFFSLRLDTTIDEQGINVRFFPFHKQAILYSRERIKNAYVRTYKPIREFGGWGLRGGAYNVSGNKGLQLEFKDGGKFLIGTNQPEKMQEAINEFLKGS